MPTLFSELPIDDIGELYLNSIERDGTSQGLDLQLLELLPKGWDIPVILAGGAGKWSQICAALTDDRVDAVATAELLNFVGNGLQRSRLNLIASGIDLPGRLLTLEAVHRRPLPTDLSE